MAAQRELVAAGVGERLREEQVAGSGQSAQFLPCTHDAPGSVQQVDTVGSTPSPKWTNNKLGTFLLC